MLLFLLFVFQLATGNVECFFRRIVGGYEARIEDFPYIVYVKLPKNFMCGGAIIKSNLVLSAAHCFDSEGEYSIMAGTDNLHYPGVWRKVVEIEIHPNYDDESLANDVAVLKLDRHLEFSPTIGAIQLPKSPEVPFDWGIVMGWGEHHIPGLSRNKLRAVRVEVFSNRICQRRLYPYGLKLYENMFCAGHTSEKKDSCVGDSGGPFVINNTVYGVVSHGTYPCNKGAPGIYTDIPHVMNWINTII